MLFVARGIGKANVLKLVTPYKFMLTVFTFTAVNTAFFNYSLPGIGVFFSALATATTFAAAAFPVSTDHSLR